MATLRRVFLGWDRPLLHSTIEYLVDQYTAAKVWDLSELTIVLQVVRAGKRLRELLEETVQQNSYRARLPRIITVGSLPETLYEPDCELAGEMQQTLAWTRALLDTEGEALKPLLPTLPAREPVAPWLEMASTLRRLTEDLAADAMRPADVIQHVTTANERERWGQIAALHVKYLAELGSCGLADPHQQRQAATQDNRCRIAGEVLVVGCVDLGGSVCQMLDRIADQATIIVGAPAEREDLFDPYGRVVPGRWDNLHVEIEDEQLISAGDANQQAAAAADWLQTHGDKKSSPRTTIGITDFSFGPLVATELKLCGETSYLIGADQLTRTPPGRMLQRVSEFLVTRSWSSLAALLRHADVCEHFAGTHGTSLLLNELDHFRSAHFPVTLDDPWPESVAGPEAFPLLKEVTAEVIAWLHPFEERLQRLATWAKKLKAFVAEFYKVDDEKSSVSAAEILLLFENIGQIPSKLDVKVSASAAIELILQRLANPRSLTQAEPGAIEIAGWLDLTLDDSPRVIVIGLNQPFVPQAVTADPFLPGTLRTRLTVADNERRFARDLYVLQMIQQTRTERAYVVGRFGPDGSPTPPSRLLAACPSNITLRRVRLLLEKPPIEPEPKTLWDAKALFTDLPIPSASRKIIPSSVSVTAFGSYIQCPFRFYLRHVMRIRPLDDAGFELAANQFGDLVHAAVENYGACGDKDLTNVDAIEKSLKHHLHAYANQMYGERTTAAVRLQISQAEKRLKIFAERQAQRIAGGWRIEQAEAEVHSKHGAVIRCADGRELTIKGRIDRIDYHPASGRWAILDYKTHGHKPIEKHYDAKNKRWIDLQLPLYLLMLKALDIDADYDHVDVGYFNIPGDPTRCEVNPLLLDPVSRADAFATAGQIAGNILDGNFAPQLDPSQVPYDDFGMILQTGISENLMLANDDFGDSMDVHSTGAGV